MSFKILIFICVFGSVIEVSAFGLEAPKDQEVCFAPDEPCDEKLLLFIKNAKKSIDVAIYDINLDQVVHELILQSKKIPVRIVVDQRQSKGQHSLVSTLLKAGVNVRYGHQRGIMHDKFVIVDSEELETGSFNFTNHATLANQENQLYLTQHNVIQRYIDRYEKIWATAKPIDKLPRNLVSDKN